MRIIELKGDKWASVLDFHEALLKALQAPDWHSASVHGTVQSIVRGGVLKVEPPYKIVVTGAAALPDEVRRQIELIAGLVRRERIYRKKKDNVDVDVSMEHDGPLVGVSDIEDPDGENPPSEAELIEALQRAFRDADKA